MASDLLRPGLELVFCGYNPSLTSGLSGHHYAHPGNRFWRVLFAAGITGRLYRPEEEELLLECPSPPCPVRRLVSSGRLDLGIQGARAERWLGMVWGREQRGRAR
jgi:hypothetical protein